MAAATFADKFNYLSIFPTFFFKFKSIIIFHLCLKMTIKRILAIIFCQFFIALGQEVDGGDEEREKPTRYEIVTFNWEVQNIFPLGNIPFCPTKEVRLPMTIVLWIFLASIAKICT
jgi:hypothetical protein